jgi:hypothetical protein
MNWERTHEKFLKAQRLVLRDKGFVALARKATAG